MLYINNTLYVKNNKNIKNINYNQYKKYTFINNNEVLSQNDSKCIGWLAPLVHFPLDEENLLGEIVVL